MTAHVEGDPAEPRRRPRTAFSPDDDIVELQKAAADGDPGAWRALVQRFSPLVWSVSRAHRLSVSDAEDVYQFVWLTLTQNLGDINEPTFLAGWLYRVARNECLRVAGRTGRYVLTENVVEARRLDEGEYADAFILLEARNAELWRQVDRLPDKCRVLLRALVADPQPSYDELAVRFDMAIGSVGPTRQRCLERLRRGLALIRIKQDQDDL
jgi:RNA polymerase sigma factor (sigma-70 family)